VVEPRADHHAAEEPDDAVDGVGSLESFDAFRDLVDEPDGPVGAGLGAGHRQCPIVGLRSKMQAQPIAEQVGSPAVQMRPLQAEHEASWGEAARQRVKVAMRVSRIRIASPECSRQARQPIEVGMSPPGARGETKSVETRGFVGPL